MFTVLAMGLIGLGCLLPIYCIQWAWNLCAAHTSFMPSIGGWQALMLYLAGAALIYLTGLVEIKIERAD